MHEDAFRVRDGVCLEAFSVMDSCRKIDFGDGVGSESSRKLHGRFG